MRRVVLAALLVGAAAAPLPAQRAARPSQTGTFNVDALSARATRITLSEGETRTAMLRLVDR